SYEPTRQHNHTSGNPASATTDRGSPTIRHERASHFSHDYAANGITRPRQLWVLGRHFVPNPIVSVRAGPPEDFQLQRSRTQRFNEKRPVYHCAVIALDVAQLNGSESKYVGSNSLKRYKT